MIKTDLTITKHAYIRAKERTPYRSKEKFERFVEAAYFFGKRLAEDESIRKEIRDSLLKDEKISKIEFYLYRGQGCVFSIPNKTLITIYGVQEYKKKTKEFINQSQIINVA